MNTLFHPVVLINPLSSGRYLIDAFIELGVPVVSIYEPRWRDAADHDQRSSVVRIVPSDDLLETVLSLGDVLAVIPGSEDGVQHADRLAAARGLPHNDVSMLGSRRDKQLMMDALRSRGLVTPWSVKVTTHLEAAAALRRCPTAEAVIKPLDSAGGDRVSICRSERDVVDAYRAIDGSQNFMRVSTSGACVQERLVGVQFAVNTISSAGVHYLTEIYEQVVQQVTSSQQSSRHLITVAEDGDEAAVLVPYALACLDALGIREGPAHTEIMLTDDGPVIIEVNSRLMGPTMEPDPYARALGFVPQNVYARSLLGFPLGDQLHLMQPRKYLARTYIRTKRSQSGVVTGVRNIDTIRTLAGFHSLSALARVGSVVDQGNVTTGGTGIAYFVHADRKVLVDSLTLLHELEDSGHFYEISSA